MLLSEGSDAQFINCRICQYQLAFPKIVLYYGKKDTLNQKKSEFGVNQTPPRTYSAIPNFDLSPPIMPLNTIFYSWVPLTGHFHGFFICLLLSRSPSLYQWAECIVGVFGTRNSRHRHHPGFSSLCRSSPHPDSSCVPIPDHPLP